jgi:hypothetical protein
MSERENEEVEGDQESRRGRFRDDPLSMFLAFAALLLGLMYYLEQTQQATLEDANVRAQQVGVTQLDLEGCVTEAAGKKGATLVIACDSTADDAVRRAGALSPEIPGFDEVFFVGSDRRLRCPTDASRWPEACAVSG